MPPLSDKEREQKAQKAYDLFIKIDRGYTGSEPESLFKRVRTLLDQANLKFADIMDAMHDGGMDGVRFDDLLAFYPELKRSYKQAREAEAGYEKAFKDLYKQYTDTVEEHQSYITLCNALDRELYRVREAANKAASVTMSFSKPQLRAKKKYKRFSRPAKASVRNDDWKVSAFSETTFELFSKLDDPDIMSAVQTVNDLAAHLSTRNTNFRSVFKRKTLGKGAESIRDVERKSFLYSNAIHSLSDYLNKVQTIYHDLGVEQALLQSECHAMEQEASQTQIDIDYWDNYQANISGSIPSSSSGRDWNAFRQAIKSNSSVSASQTQSNTRQVFRSLGAIFSPNEWSVKSVLASLALVTVTVLGYTHRDSIAKFQQSRSQQTTQSVARQSSAPTTQSSSPVQSAPASSQQVAVTSQPKDEKRQAPAKQEVASTQSASSQRSPSYVVSNEASRRSAVSQDQPSGGVASAASSKTETKTKTTSSGSGSTAADPNYFSWGSAFVKQSNAQVWGTFGSQGATDLLGSLDKGTQVSVIYCKNEASASAHLCSYGEELRFWTILDYSRDTLRRADQLIRVLVTPKYGETTSAFIEMKNISKAPPAKPKAAQKTSSPPEREVYRSTQEALRSSWAEQGRSRDYLPR